MQGLPSGVAIAFAHDVASAAVRSDSHSAVVASFGAVVPHVAVAVIVDVGPAVQAVVPALGEGVAVADRALAAARIGPADFVAVHVNTIDGASVLGARDVLPFHFAPGALAGAVDGSHLADVVLARNEFVRGHLAERMHGVGIEDRLVVDALAHHLEVFEVTVVSSGNILSKNVVGGLATFVAQAHVQEVLGTASDGQVSGIVVTAEVDMELVGVANLKLEVVIAASDVTI